ncbi:hypothetical protein C7W93_03070 [Glaciimonas sp. PCH181]|nr:hypothetical protein C7W93_03070 [Glaciimonas sp. PCH181]
MFFLFCQTLQCITSTNCAKSTYMTWHTAHLVRRFNKNDARKMRFAGVNLVPIFEAIGSPAV